jgi:hypothetical protein
MGVALAIRNCASRVGRAHRRAGDPLGRVDHRPASWRSPEQPDRPGSELQAATYSSSAPTPRVVKTGRFEASPEPVARARLSKLINLAQPCTTCSNNRSTTALAVSSRARPRCDPNSERPGAGRRRLVDARNRVFSLRRGRPMKRGAGHESCLRPGYTAPERFFKALAALRTAARRHDRRAGRHEVQASRPNYAVERRACSPTLSAPCPPMAIPARPSRANRSASPRTKASAAPGNYAAPPNERPSRETPR